MSQYPIVVMAAHMVYNRHNKRFSKNIKFMPYSEKLKFKIRPIAAVIPKGWKETGGIEYDTAFLIFDSEAFDGLKDKVIPAPILFNAKGQLDYEIYGFTGMSKEKLITANAVSLVDSLSLKAEIDIKKSIYEGQWYTQINDIYYMNAVTSYCSLNAERLLYGAYWGNSIKKSYDYAVGKTYDRSDLIIYYF